MINPDYAPFVPIAVTVFSVVLVPIVAKTVMWVRGALDERNARAVDEAITKRLQEYTPTEEIDMQIEQLGQQQAQQAAAQERHHAENKELLNRIHDEGIRREGLLTGQIRQAQEENRASSAKTDAAMSELHRRVDRVLELSGERRSR